MEPRPSRPNRPASSAGRTQRAAWVPPEGADDLTAPRTAETYPSASGSQTGGPWYGPHGSLGPEPQEYRATKPPMPIKPRGERGNKWLRYLLAALLLAVVVGGSAFAITWFFDDDEDDPNELNTQAQVTATTDVAAQTPLATETPQTMAEPTATTQAEPTATSAPADTPAPTEPPAGNDSEIGAASEGSVNRSAADYLPTTDELEGAWLVFDEGERTRAEVGEQLGENGEDTLIGLLWETNEYRDFTLEGGENLPDDTTFLSISVHQFGTADGAQEALSVLSNIVIGAGYQETTPVDVGDSSVALQAPSDGANVYVLYVQDGNIVIRFGGSSITGDPAPTVNAVAEQVVAGE